MFSTVQVFHNQRHALYLLEHHMGLDGLMGFWYPTKNFLDWLNIVTDPLHSLILNSP